MLQRQFGVTFDVNRVFDTLVAAKLVSGQTRNSLSDWAHRLGHVRSPFKGADVWTEYAEDHAVRDAHIVAALYRYIVKTVIERTEGAAEVAA